MSSAHNMCPFDKTGTDAAVDKALGTLLGPVQTRCDQQVQLQVQQTWLFQEML